MIGPTLEFCAHNVPYYREVFGDRWREISSMAELSALPLLDKATAIAVQEGLRSGVEPIPSPILSSGTKRDGSQVLEVLVSQQELDEQHAIIEKLEGGPQKGAARRELVIINAHHGLPFERTSSHRVLVPFMPHDNSFVQVLRLLERTFDDGPDDQIAAILASVGNLKALTVWLLERGVDPAAFAVRNIGTNSSVLTHGWRATLGRLWNARLWDNYSLSEFRTHATECELCGRYHFDHLPIGLELIDASGQPSVGRGELVLTSLYPYAQAMPLVRYQTGDLVEAHKGCETGELGLVFLGRASDCVLDAAGRIVVTTREILECLETFSDVEREPTLFEQLGMVAPGQLGWPDFSLDERVLTVRMTSTPALYPERATRIREALEALTRGQIEIQLAGPKNRARVAPL